MMTIAYKRLGSSSRGLVMWQIACLALIRVVWRERSVRIFEDKVRTLDPFGPLAPQLLWAFPLMWFNLIDFWCVVSKVWSSKERLLFEFSIWFMEHHGCIGLLSMEISMFSSLFLRGFFILLLYLLNPNLIYFITVSHKKNVLVSHSCTYIE